MGLFFTTAVYVLGGVTFLPLLLLLILIHAHFTLPYRDDVNETPAKRSLLRTGDDEEAIRTATAELDDKFKSSGDQPNDVAAGFFTVCREYTPGGVDSKQPLERTTPAGSTTITAPSPSVYQSMYRSIFDRKQPASPFENKSTPRIQKKGGNVFYVVLRHNHLILFGDEQQIEVLYVISLAHHHVSIYGGGEEIPDGELYIKRNALCLSRKSDAGDLTADGVPSKPFFLFCDDTSNKEDFYFAMLRNQERSTSTEDTLPIPLQFDVKDVIGLVQRLHSSEEHLQTRWINAIIGRIFLGLYKTSDVENFVRAKITKKISRVKTPAFLSKIVLRNVDMGESAPYITNPRLKDLTVDGDCVVEADMKYTGNFRLEIAATARIELGTRFKAREVDLVLAVVLKKIEGHMQLRIKPPPSNRLWYTFVTMPRIEMSIEPIVSARQITYTLILRQIENRIKEVIAESVVMPFWDDSSFSSTEGKKWRGGIWVDDAYRSSHIPSGGEDAAAEEGDVETVENFEGEILAADPDSLDKSMSGPSFDATAASTIYARKAAKSMFNLGGKIVGSSTSIDSSKSSTSEKPKAIRLGSFTSSASSPILSTDNMTVDAFKTSTPPEHSHAAAAMAAISAKSQTATPVGSPSRSSGFGARDKVGSVSSISSVDSAWSDNSGTVHASVDDHEADIAHQNIAGKRGSISQGSLAEVYPSSPASSSGSSLQSKLPRVSTTDSLESRSPPSNFASGDSAGAASNKRATLTVMANAAASAKKWGLDALAARRAAQAVKEAAAMPDLSHPIGRGRPLPPPGMPLPPPDRKTKTAPIPVPKRRPLQAPPLKGQESQEAPAIQRPSVPPRLPQRRSHSPIKNDDEHEGVFVVEAPDSEPTTPMGERRAPLYIQPSVEDAYDSDDANSSTLRVSPELSQNSARKASPLRQIGKENNSTPPDLPKRHNDKPPSPPLPRRRAGTGNFSSSSAEVDTDRLPTWMKAQEEEARSKTMWVDEDSGNMHQ